VDENQGHGPRLKGKVLGLGVGISKDGNAVGLTSIFEGSLSGASSVYFS